MLITKKKKKKKWEVAGSDVSMSQCSRGESIETTSFGQNDRQTYLSRIFYSVRFWSAKDFSCFKKYTEMEKTGKNYCKSNKLINMYIIV